MVNLYNWNPDWGTDSFPSMFLTNQQFQLSSWHKNASGPVFQGHVFFKPQGSKQFGNLQPWTWPIGATQIVFLMHTPPKKQTACRWKEALRKRKELLPTSLFQRSSLSVPWTSHHEMYISRASSSFSVLKQPSIPSRNGKWCSSKRSKLYDDTGSTLTAGRYRETKAVNSRLSLSLACLRLRALSCSKTTWKKNHPSTKQKINKKTLSIWRNWATKETSVASHYTDCLIYGFLWWATFPIEGKMFIPYQINQPTKLWACVRSSFFSPGDCLWVPAIFLHFVETGAQFSSDQC